MAEQTKPAVQHDPLWCPSCGSAKLRRGEQNLWCATCGFFPIPYAREPVTRDYYAREQVARKRS